MSQQVRCNSRGVRGEVGSDRVACKDRLHREFTAAHIQISIIASRTRSHLESDSIEADLREPERCSMQSTGLSSGGDFSSG